MRRMPSHESQSHYRVMPCFRFSSSFLLVGFASALLDTDASSFLSSLNLTVSLKFKLVLPFAPFCFMNSCSFFYRYEGCMSYNVNI